MKILKTLNVNYTFGEIPKMKHKVSITYLVYIKISVNTVCRVTVTIKFTTVLW